MAKRNRSTLRNYFRGGAMPTGEHFADLIDSSLNTLEDGFDKTLEQGFKISALDDNASLVSFYRESTPETPLWSISYDQQIDTLLFNRRLQAQPGDNLVDGLVDNLADSSADNSASNTPEHQAHKAVLAMTQQGCIGINKLSPTQALDIKGAVKSDGRLGSQLGLEQDIPADGKWHNISPKLEGCQLFEVVAGVGIKRSGRYALLHAHAMNTCNPTGFWFNFLKWKNPIKCQHAHYNSSADKLKLRWFTAPQEEGDNQAYRPYYLQIKSNSDYGEGVYIRYHITRLWFDQYMQNSLDSGDGEG